MDGAGSFSTSKPTEGKAFEFLQLRRKLCPTMALLKLRRTLEQSYGRREQTRALMVLCERRSVSSTY